LAIHRFSLFPRTLPSLYILLVCSFWSVSFCMYKTVTHLCYSVIITVRIKGWLVLWHGQLLCIVCGLRCLYRYLLETLCGRCDLDAISCYHEHKLFFCLGYVLTSAEFVPVKIMLGEVYPFPSYIFMTRI
jgi:hypothetical protein